MNTLDFPETTTRFGKYDESAITEVINLDNLSKECVSISAWVIKINALTFSWTSFDWSFRRWNVLSNALKRWDDAKNDCSNWKSFKTFVIWLAFVMNDFEDRVMLMKNKEKKQRNFIDKKICLRWFQHMSIKRISKFNETIEVNEIEDMNSNIM